MKIVRKINIIQVVTTVAFISMVMVAMYLISIINAHVNELTREDMVIESHMAGINEAYLKQMTAVARAIRYGMEDGAAAEQGFKREHAVYEEFGQTLNNEVAETRATLVELLSMTSDADPMHVEEVTYISEQVELIAHDVEKYEALTTEVFAKLEEGHINHAKRLAAEADEVAAELGELVHMIDEHVSAAVIASVDAIHEAEDLLVEDLIISAVISILVAVGIGFWISLSIRKSLDSTNKSINHIIENRDLSVRVPESKDELGQMAGNFNQMLTEFHGVLGEMTAASTQLAAAAEELSAVTEESSAGVQKQSSETDQVATAMNEMSASMSEVASNTASVSQAANHADQQAGEGREIVLQSIDVIRELASEVDKASEVISELSVDSQNIGSVMDVIIDIAEQTNLLALNAAIEAARAGEQGRGFAVVADEVRTLAQRTQESTLDIRKTIERLQSRAESAVQVMQVGKEKAEQGVSASSQAEESLASINTAVTTINDMVTQTASATEEQSAVAEEINRSLVSIRDVSSEVSVGAGQTAQASNDIAQLATNLQGMVARFKL